ncbi:hypothetical protein J1TS5_32690 [Paenibacillus macerans]|nr:hypothetical protein J1TS5_32690 [Paenibacillus macerans]
MVLICKYIIPTPWDLAKFNSSEDDDWMRAVCHNQVVLALETGSTSALAVLVAGLPKSANIKTKTRSIADLRG